LRHSTNYLVWVLVSSLFFFLLGWVPFFDDRNRFWLHVWRWCTGHYIQSTVDCMVDLFLFAGILMIPSALLGWVCQALLVVVVTNTRRVKQSVSTPIRYPDEGIIYAPSELTKSEAVMRPQATDFSCLKPPRP
jgi:hypothetical protein